MYGTYVVFVSKQAVSLSHSSPLSSTSSFSLLIICYNTCSNRYIYMRQGEGREGWNCNSNKYYYLYYYSVRSTSTFLFMSSVCPHGVGSTCSWQFDSSLSSDALPYASIWRSHLWPIVLRTSPTHRHLPSASFGN